MSPPWSKPSSDLPSPPSHSLPVYTIFTLYPHSILSISPPLSLPVLNFWPRFLSLTLLTHKLPPLSITNHTMSDDELTTRFLSFKLTVDEQNEVALFEEDVKASENECRSSLFGKIISQKPANLTGLKNTMGLIWGNPKNFRVIEVGKDLYKFILPSEVDVIRILNSKPWFFNNHFLNLERWNPKLLPHQYCFDFTSTWVQIWGLPIQYMSMEVGLKLGTKLGTVEDVSIPITGSKDGRFIRVKVYVNITLPLKRGCMVKLASSKPFWVEFRYERLPTFCCYCGMVGHDLQGCDKRFFDMENDELKDSEYGAWIRASPATRPSQKSSTSTPARQRPAGDPDLVSSGDSASQEGNRPQTSNLNNVSKEGPASKSGTHSSDLAPSAISPTLTDNNQCLNPIPFASGTPPYPDPPSLPSDLDLIDAPISTSTIKTLTQNRTGSRKTTFTRTVRKSPQNAIKGKHPTTVVQNSDSILPSSQGKRKFEGVGIPLTFHQLKEFSRLHSPSLFFLSETKNGVTRLEVVKRALGMDGSLWVDPVGSAGGLALFWKGNHTVELQRMCSWFIDVKILDIDNNRSWRLCNVYFNSKPEVRKAQREQFLHYKVCLGDDWVLWGDMNDIVSVDEKRGGTQPQPWETRGFQDFINNCHLIDLGFSGYPFTWRNNRKGEGYIQERLDRVLASPHWRTRFDHAKVEHLNTVGSDHCALLMDLNPNETHNRVPFRFDSRWVKEEEMQNVVQQPWNTRVQGSRLFTVHSKIKECLFSIQNWKKGKKLNSGRQVIELHREIHSLQSGNFPPNRTRIQALKEQLQQEWDKEEEFWRQKSRINWLQQGDKNTGFFHASVLQRRTRNRITGIENSNDDWVSNGPTIAAEFQQYFQELFTANPVFDMVDTVAAIPTKITSHMNHKLTRLVMATEVHEALMAMPPIKAPGIDGRQILDNILIFHEVMHTLKCRRHGRKGWFALKLDMAKAYDRIEWKYIEAVMRKFGFDETWIKWVMNCVETVSFAIVINGNKGDFFQPQRGIRQGCPLSPYLFILCAEGLHYLIHDAVSSGVMRGVKLSRGCPSISHLFFADDSVIFGEATSRNCTAINEIFLKYERASGQLLNRDKSSIFFSPNTVRQ
ncbi:hypothetical protein Vadar_016441 [Vaccinium darrowii]|uniref:Uncharacterized protein n=1 Tax=Vaccinium darrowii TaxID=229202 RepID=A0ACB7XID9_9ERIC|nr:hypothetical protein Vadar_016441 [Vaccinium darrowii]